MENLDLSKNKIVNINGLKTDFAEKLKKLNLSFNIIKGIEILKEIKFKNLEELDLIRNDLNNEDKQIIEILKNKFKYNNLSIYY